MYIDFINKTKFTKSFLKSNNKKRFLLPLQRPFIQTLPRKFLPPVECFQKIFFLNINI